MMAIKYSIRIKFFIPIILIPTIVIVLFLLVGKNLLNHEKTNYLANSLSQTSRALGQMVIAELKKVEVLKNDQTNYQLASQYQDKNDILSYKKINLG